MTSTRHTLAGHDAINLWRRGRDAWHQWVNQHPEADIDFTGVDFSKHRGCTNIPAHEWPFAAFRFPKGEVIFSNAQFGAGYVSFSKAKFGAGDVSFSKAQFGEGNVSFYKANFKGETNFIQTSLGLGEYNFEQADFAGRVIFDALKNTRSVQKFSFKFALFEKSLEIAAIEPFECIVDLTRTKTTNKVSLEHLVCHLKTEPHWVWFRQASDKNDIERLRRLKQMAEENKDHQQALKYKIMEMQAARWHKTNRLGPLALELLFYLLSDYGRSIIKPIGWLLGLTLLLTLHYTQFEWPPITIQGLGRGWLAIWHADWHKPIECAVNNALPLLSNRREVLSACRELYTTGGSVWFSTGHSLLSFALLFLTGLGLRNRFRL
jgi:hypothetical protein